MSSNINSISGHLPPDIQPGLAPTPYTEGAVVSQPPPLHAPLPSSLQPTPDDALKELDAESILLSEIHRKISHQIHLLQVEEVVLKTQVDMLAKQAEEEHVAADPLSDEATFLHPQAYAHLDAMPPYHDTGDDEAVHVGADMHTILAMPFHTHSASAHLDPDVLDPQHHMHSLGVPLHDL